MNIFKVKTNPYPLCNTPPNSITLEVDSNNETESSSDTKKRKIEMPKEGDHLMIQEVPYHITHIFNGKQSAVYYKNPPENIPDEIAVFPIHKSTISVAKEVFLYIKPRSGKHIVSKESLLKTIHEVFQNSILMKNHSWLFDHNDEAYFAHVRSIFGDNKYQTIGNSTKIHIEASDEEKLTIMEKEEEILPNEEAVIEVIANDQSDPSYVFFGNLHSKLERDENKQVSVKISDIRQQLLQANPLTLSNTRPVEIGGDAISVKLISIGNHCPLNSKTAYKITDRNQLFRFIPGTNTVLIDDEKKEPTIVTSIDVRFTNIIMKQNCPYEYPFINIDSVKKLIEEECKKKPFTRNHSYIKEFDDFTLYYNVAPSAEFYNQQSRSEIYQLNTSGFTNLDYDTCCRGKFSLISGSLAAAKTVNIVAFLPSLDKSLESAIKEELIGKLTYQSLRLKIKHNNMIVETQCEFLNCTTNIGKITKETKINISHYHHVEETIPILSKDVYFQDVYETESKKITEFLGKIGGNSEEERRYGISQSRILFVISNSDDGKFFTESILSKGKKLVSTIDSKNLLPQELKNLIPRIHNTMTTQKINNLVITLEDSLTTDYLNAFSEVYKAITNGILGIQTCIFVLKKKDQKVSIVGSNTTTNHLEINLPPMSEKIRKMICDELVTHYTQANKLKFNFNFENGNTKKLEQFSRKDFPVFFKQLLLTAFNDVESRKKSLITQDHFNEALKVCQIKKSDESSMYL